MKTEYDRNLFSYATKEFSQDGFIMLCLFNNWNSEYDDVQEAARTFIRSFSGFKPTDKVDITELDTKAHEHRIDVLVTATIN
ncbi:MAG: hypothetical protein ACOC2U_01410, partial [bacterium]